MRPATKRCRLILGVFLSTIGVGYALFEGEQLIDWGVKIPGKEKINRRIAAAAALMSHYGVDVVVLEDHAGAESRRSPQLAAIIDLIRDIALERKIIVRKYSRAEMRATFGSGQTVSKHVIAQRIVERYPELRRECPEKRQSWNAESKKMPLFDAAALVMTHFAQSGRAGKGVRGE